MVRTFDFSTVRTLDDWLDRLSPARQEALLVLWGDAPLDSGFTAREVYECISDYYGGFSAYQSVSILAELFGWS